MRIKTLNTLNRFAPRQWVMGLAACLILTTAIFAQAPVDNSKGEIFRAGDGILLSVPMDTESVINGSFPIDSAGYADLPVVGRIFVHNKTSRQVEDYVSREMAQYLRDTHVRAKPAVRLLLVGFWQHPGMHYVEANASVWEAAKLAGGPAGEVNIKKWIVMRGSEDLTLPILDEFSRGTTLRNAGVQSGDIFVIPVPNEHSGFWYWFTQGLSATAQVATVATAVLSVYIAYLIYHDTNNNGNNQNTHNDCTTTVTGNVSTTNCHTYPN